MKNIVFDSWPLIAFFEEESAAEEVEKLFLKCRTNNSNMIISTVNLGGNMVYGGASTFKE